MKTRWKGKWDYGARTIKIILGPVSNFKKPVSVLGRRMEDTAKGRRMLS